ncbi:hypothetical protein HC251_02335 [Iamia sp. SCSIO 61187]|uniref:hypothetical protein n=1 Tax=Iamia sp. SCSIO 61187 TaxID=2722752 RepID=UPI001C62A29B|nr:hypothetical protein [Iamia sp. SCSIO 61187]QYG91387.1 hypothetical protein HC251_02335 [Iamia sp. SCSIO 61187]
MTDVAPVVDLTRRDAALDLTRPAPAAGDTSLPPPAGRGRLRRLWFVPAGVALLGAAALVPSVGRGGPGPGEARVLVDGEAVLTEADGETTTVRDERVDVGPGDRIEITDGTAVFEMADEVRLEGRAGGAGGLDGTTVEMAVTPRLVAGRLLVDAPAPLELRAGPATVTVAPRGATDGAARLDRRIGLGVDTYRGEVAVESAGRRVDVPRYRRAEIAAPGALGPQGLPLRYEADDPWDRRYLGDALVIDAQVAPLLASLGPEGREEFLDPAALRRAMPGVPRDRTVSERIADADDGGDALVLAAIAGAVEDRSFTDAWDRAESFHADGAPWGLAALDQGARSAPVLAALRDALDTVDLQAPTVDDGDAGDGSDGPPATTTPEPPGGGDAPAEVPTDGGAPAPGDGGTGPIPDPGAGGTPPPPSSGGTAPPPPSSPTPSLPTPDVPGVVGGISGEVGGVVGGVTDGVDAIVPGAGTAIDDVVGGLGDAVGGLGDAVGGIGTTVPGTGGDIVEGLGDTVGALGPGLGGG